MSAPDLPNDHYRKLAYVSTDDLYHRVQLDMDDTRAKVTTVSASIDDLSMALERYSSLLPDVETQCQQNLQAIFTLHAEIIAANSSRAPNIGALTMWLDVMNMLDPSWISDDTAKLTAKQARAHFAMRQLSLLTAEETITNKFAQLRTKITADPSTFPKLHELVAAKA